jgi:hypothetical protein
MACPIILREKLSGATDGEGHGDVCPYPIIYRIGTQYESSKHFKK